MLGNCRICNSNEWLVAYEGPVRKGVFGQTAPGVVYKCGRCGVEFLPPVVQNLNAYYQSGAYRRDLGELLEIDNFFKLHDSEQLLKYSLLQGIPIRNQVIADVGCAGGSFLDGVHGFASATIGIEPAIGYHESLCQRGHRVYDDVTKALPEWSGGVQLATCFSVIEHIEDPVRFLQNIRTLLSQGGCLLLSTPNRRDILLEMGNDAYKSFFYRIAHVFYFDQDSLRAAAEAAGFSLMEFRYVHRFNFANYVGWLRQQKPEGNIGQTVLGPTFDHIWRATLEEHGVADYLYAYLRF